MALFFAFPLAVRRPLYSRAVSEAPRGGPRRFGPIAIAVALLVLGIWYFQRWRANRTHHIELRALVDVETCRVRVEYQPGPPLDPIAQQSGVLAPWHLGFEANEEQEVTLRVWGDASCGGAIRCEIEVDGVIIARKTTQMQKDGVDSASCAAMAVKTRAQ